MTNRYDNREIFSVDAGLIQLAQTDDGPIAWTSLHIDITSIDGTQMGPGIAKEPKENLKQAFCKTPLFRVREE